MSTRNPNTWLFGAIPDLLFGSGLLYLLIVTGLVVLGTTTHEMISADLVPYLILVVSGSHYGGTLLRVYERDAERRTYRLFTVHGTALMVVVLLFALYSPIVGSMLITLYLTWSPWHYTGQNYGIAVMMLRRRGVEISPTAKRWLYASFVFSFLSVFVTMHFEGSAGQVDPLGIRSLDPDAFQFISLGLPREIQRVVMPGIGVGIVSSLAIALTLLLQSGGVRAVAPAALLMFTQAVWFSIPYLGTYFALAARMPAFNAIDVDSYQFYFVWVALGHAIQYLWITAYYARADPRWRGFSRYFTKVFVFGNAVWAAPVVLFGPELLGRPDYDLGLAMCVAATVNLHHFMLDGAIWKLRNPNLAAVLLKSQAGTLQDPVTRPSSVWMTRIAWTLAGLFCLARLVPYVELDRRFPAALERHDFATAAAILDRAAFYGRDSAPLRIRLANRLTSTRAPGQSLRQYRRGLELNPNAAGFVELGRLAEKFQDVDNAISVWQQGVELFPDDYDLVFNLGDALLQTYRAGAALPYLERAVAMRPDDVNAREALESARKRLHG